MPGFVITPITSHKFYTNQHHTWHKQLQIKFVQSRCYYETHQTNSEHKKHLCSHQCYFRCRSFWVLVFFFFWFFFLPPKPWPLLLKREECCSVASLASGKQSVCSQLEKNYPGKYPERAAATPHRKSHQGNGLFLQVHGNLSFETQSFLVA